MDARLSEEQELLRASARDFLARECPMSFVREQIEEPRRLPDALWKRMAELGWLGLCVPEAHGGAGLGLLELAVLLEETGRALLPGPLLSTVALAGAAIELSADEDQRRRHFGAIARGDERAALAWIEEPERWDAGGVHLAARRAGGGLRLSGSKRFVLDAQDADWLVVAARLESGEPALLLVDARARGLAVAPTALLDATRRAATVRLDDVAVPADALVARGEDACRRVADRAKVALCAEMLGGAQRVLEMSVAFASTREQFGRPIGSFQAIQHRLADMLLAIEGARSATWYAAWAVDAEEPGAHAAACTAKALASDAYVRVTGDGIQIHGGLGFTWEQDLHLYYRRAKVSERLFGDAGWNRELLARARIDAR
ncbi:MAG TPA: acyl-CoA dehydrogenase [Myxococcota bacterium]|nr:acyl-CoA dehydrogenase [Myxococcota bacterium]